MQDIIGGYSMFEFYFLQKIRFGLWYSKTNRHGTHIFDLRIGTKDSYNSRHSKDTVQGRVRLNKSQEIHVDILTLSQCDTGSLGIY